MATPKCAKCGGRKFEIALTERTRSASRLSLVQCASCGTPTEVIDPDLPNQTRWFARLLQQSTIARSR